jgi:LysR family transcriptional regulator, transcription activator of glutamate synthase operon
MDLRQLRSFVAVAEESQFTRAAERVGIKQSSLSAQIRSLEREIGLPLFDRTTRRVAITDAGALLLDRARVLLAGIDDATSELRRMGGLLVGRVRIGLTTTTGAIDVINLLAAFHAEHPGVDLSVVEDISVRLAKQLREDRLDVGILSVIPDHEMAGLELLTLASEPLVLVVAPGHPLALHQHVGVDELAGMPLVLPPRGATIRSTVDDAARARGITLQIVCESIEVGRMKRWSRRDLVSRCCPCLTLGLRDQRWS